jgi:hypothetical protein
MHEGKRSQWLLLSQSLILAAVLLASRSAFASDAAGAAAQGAGVAVGPQYDSTHVYVPPADIDAFVNSIVATFGGQPSKRIVGNVLPVASSTGMQYVLTPVGVLSIFAYQTPVPFPFRRGAHRIPGHRHDAGDRSRSRGGSGSDRRALQRSDRH